MEIVSVAYDYPQYIQSLVKYAEYCSESEIS